MFLKSVFVRSFVVFIFAYMVNFGCDGCGSSKKNQKQFYKLKDAEGNVATSLGAPLFLYDTMVEIEMHMWKGRKESDEVKVCSKCYMKIKKPASAEYKKVPFFGRFRRLLGVH